MELSDVYVNDNELDKFHQNYCRTHWSYKGMACEVKDCCSYIYPTLRKYMRHWHRIHKEHHDLLVCPRCTQNFEKLYFPTRHLQSDHQLLLAVSKEKASVIKVPNKPFHSPGDTLPPIFWKNYNKAEKNKDTSMEERKLAEKRRTGKTGGTFCRRTSVTQIREMRWSSLTRTLMLNSTLRKEELLITSNFTAKKFEF